MYIPEGFHICRYKHFENLKRVLLTYIISLCVLFVRTVEYSWCYGSTYCREWAMFQTTPKMCLQKIRWIPCFLPRYALDASHTSLKTLIVIISEAEYYWTYIWPKQNLALLIAIVTPYKPLITTVSNKLIGIWSTKRYTIVFQLSDCNGPVVEYTCIQLQLSIRQFKKYKVV